MSFGSSVNNEFLSRNHFTKRRRSPRHQFAQYDAEEVQADQRAGHQHHAVRVAGCQHHRDETDHEHTHSPIAGIGGDREDADPLEEQHHERQLEANAETQRQD
jgi:hypothetical protein